MHLETLHRNSLQLHNVITRDITVLHGTIEVFWVFRQVPNFIDVKNSTKSFDTDD
jgi:hypothetical protein